MKRKNEYDIVYLSVAVAIVAALGSHILYNLKTLGTIPETQPAVVWGSMTSSAIVAVTLKRHWERRRRPLLWLVLTAAVFASVLLATVAYSLEWDPPQTVATTTTALWVIVMVTAIHWLLTHNGNRHSGSTK